MTKTLKEQEELKQALDQFKQGMTQLRGTLGSRGGGAPSAASQSPGKTDQGQQTAPSTPAGETQPAGKQPTQPGAAGRQEPDEATQAAMKDLSNEGQQSFRAVFDAVQQKGRKMNAKQVADIISAWDDLGLKVVAK